MEKINFKNSRGLNLVGNLHTAKSDSVIIMSHGFTGDKSEWGRFDKTARTLNKNGYNVLAFDFSGSGESDDDSLTVGKQVDDLKCAIDFVLNKNLKNIGLLGLSLGGLVSLKAYDDKIKTMVLWAPVTDKIKYTWDKRYPKEQLQKLNEKGYITKIRTKGVRKKIIIDKQMLIDRESVDQKKLLSKIDCPVLILHGDIDSSVPIEDSKTAIKLLTNESKLYIIKGDDHDFSGKYLDEALEYTIDWFKKYFKTNI